MAATAQRRNGRIEGPRWAQKHPDTPEGLTAALNEQEARRLPLDTDPDTIDDPDVREAFLERLMADEERPGRRRSSSSAGRPANKRATPSRASSGQRARASRSQGGRRSSSSSIGRPTLTPPRRLSVSDGSGFMLGLVLYAIALNYMRYGWPGVTQWFAAKFVNRDDLTPEQILQFTPPASKKEQRRLVRRADKHPTFGPGSIFAPGTLGKLPTHVDHGRR